MFNYADKAKNLKSLNNYMLVKTLSMFTYTGLPETIPAKELEKMLQNNGYAFLAKHEGKIYAFQGGIGGTPDPYGNPTEIIVANPSLGLNKTFKLSEGVLILNDSLKLGLKPFYERINTFILENEISLYISGVNARLQKVISASDDKTKASAEVMMKKLFEGELAVIGENPIFEGVKVQAGAGHNFDPTKLIEVQQYWKSCLYNEVGLSSNFNMKRERLNESEVNQSEDSLFPLVYNMLEEREGALERMKEVFNISASVELGGVWKVKEVNLLEKVEVDEGNETSNNSVNTKQDISEVEESSTEESLGTEVVKPQLELEGFKSQIEEVQEMLVEDGISEEDKETLEALLRELQE